MFFDANLLSLKIADKCDSLSDECCRVIVATENEDGLFLMPLPNYSGPTVKGRGIKFKLSWPQIVAKLGDDGWSGDVRRVETTLKLWAEQYFWRPLRRRKPAPPQYIAAININCAVPVNLITFLADLTLCFALISTRKNIFRVVGWFFLVNFGPFNLFYFLNIFD